MINPAQKDKEINRLISEEKKRQQWTLDLIPSENIVSKEVLRALGSSLTNKYSEGYPRVRYYGGNAVVDNIENLAIERARKVFHLNNEWHVNVQPYSGSPANMAVYFALLGVGEKIMGMGLPFGGHLTHGWKVNFSGILYTPVHYAVGQDGHIDYEEVLRIARRERPKIIVAGATAYSRVIDFKKFRRIADEVNAYLMVDMAHIAGLVAAGAHPSPFPHADVVTTTTHKTLRGPRGAIIFINRGSKKAKKEKIDIALLVDKAVFPGLQGGPHDNQTAAIAIALREAMTPKFRRYGKQIVKNSRALARAFIQKGFRIVSGGTDNHLMLIDLAPQGISGKEAEKRLEECGIIVNRNTIPYDTRSPFDPSGIRLGTPSVTTRGMKEGEMKKIAEAIHSALTGDTKKATMKIVHYLCRRFPL